MSAGRRAKASNAPDVPPPPAVPDDPRQRELLAAIWAEPEAEGPRSVYADWLSERGDPRGAFIAISLKAAKIPEGSQSAEHRPVRERFDAMVKKHGKEWVAPVRPYVRSWTWRRGFLHRVVCDAGLFLEGAQALVASSPELEVQLTGLKEKQLAALAAAPLGKLAGLELAEQRLDDEQAVRLFSSPALVGLRSLTAQRMRFGGPAMKALSANPARTTLRALDLSGAPVGDAGVEALMTSAGFPELRTLVLHDCNVGIAGARAIAASTAFPRLELLNLDYNRIQDEGAQLLAAGLTGFPALRKLSITTSGLTSVGVQALAGRL